MKAQSQNRIFQIIRDRNPDMKKELKVTCLLSLVTFSMHLTLTNLDHFSRKKTHFSISCSIYFQFFLLQSFCFLLLTRNNIIICINHAIFHILTKNRNGHVRFQSGTIKTTSKWHFPTFYWILIREDFFVPLECSGFCWWD